jgi:hypothetical protein
MIATGQNLTIGINRQRQSAPNQRPPSLSRRYHLGQRNGARAAPRPSLLTHLTRAKPSALTLAS